MKGLSMLKWGGKRWRFDVKRIEFVGALGMQVWRNDCVRRGATFGPCFSLCKQ